MNKYQILLAKVAALKKSFGDIVYERNRCLGHYVIPLFQRYTSTIKELKEINPELFDDLPEIEIPEKSGDTIGAGPLFDKHQIYPLESNLNYILELNSNIRIGEKIEEKEKMKRVFISHGKSKEWYKIQNYLERDLSIPTMELAQEPNLGRTVLQKLNEESNKCSVAIIVMTGDDMSADGELKARENVMHEIGYFQGKYGLGNIILLHEEGVNIPTNIHGLVYIGFAKDTAEATLFAIVRELKVMFA